MKEYEVIITIFYPNDQTRIAIANSNDLSIHPDNGILTFEDRDSGKEITLANIPYKLELGKEVAE